MGLRLLASGIVFGAKGWVGQHLIGLLQQKELFSIGGLRVVWVKTSRQESINAADCFALSIGTDLKEFVVVRTIQNVFTRRNGVAKTHRTIRYTKTPSN